jgi:hypothetical protein
MKGAIFYMRITLKDKIQMCEGLCFPSQTLVDLMFSENIELQKYPIYKEYTKKVSKHVLIRR